MSDNGNGVDQLRAENASLRRQLEGVHRDSEPGFSAVGRSVRGISTAFRFVAAVLAVVVPLISTAWYLLNLQIAAAETRMELRAQRDLPDKVDTAVEVRLRGVATRDQVAAQEQHLSDIDRRLFDIDAKLTKLLDRRR